MYENLVKLLTEPTNMAFMVVFTEKHLLVSSFNVGVTRPVNSTA